jgi:hypothetical protein
VCRLGHAQKIDARLRQAARLGGRHPIVDAGMRLGMGNLRRTGVAGDHPLETRRQGHRRLAAARGAVPSQAVPGALAGEPVEQRLGVARPVIGIARRVGGEVVLEAAHMSSRRIRSALSMVFAVHLPWKLGSNLNLAPRLDWL